MTEAELDRAVRDLQRKYGLRGFCVGDSRRSPSGWPDWVIVGNGVMFRELKTAYGEVSTAQRAWGFALRHAGADWDVWRPVDLATGRIERELAAIGL